MSTEPSKAPTIGFIGFGEAARAFVGDWREKGLAAEICAYDILLDDERSQDKLVAACSRLNVTPRPTAKAVRDASNYLISAVTPDQLLAAARSVGGLGEHQRYLDINSAAPDKKKSAARIIGAGYLDVAVLSPVHPKRSAAPMLVAGARAFPEAAFLTRYFPGAEAFSEGVGEASLVKMVRSIFVKGIEAVATECALAIRKTGLADRIYPSLDLVLRHPDARALTSYTLERVANHGKRRAAEMEEVCATLADLDLPSPISKATAELQRIVGELHIDTESSADAEQTAAKILQRIT